MIIETFSYPRAAVIGNPSDGYFGKTIAFVFSNFSARVQLYHTPELEIIPAKLDITKFNSVGDLVSDVNLHGYYGGERLLKAAIKVFYDHCKSCNIQIDERNFTLRYSSDIPHRLGLAGSSAIITACMKAMMAFYGVAIPKPVFANLILSVETMELGISAGLQDRVTQAYGTPVFMDFDEELMKKQGFGNYKLLDAELLPNFYIGFRRDQSEGSEVTHNNLKARFRIGEQKVLDAMEEWAELTVRFADAMKRRDENEMHSLLNRNFDIRKELIDITPKNIEMVELARSTGASAKFTGSGGAIIGTYKDESMYDELASLLNKNEIEVIKPQICN
jgi:glucuronokinase